MGVFHTITMLLTIIGIQFREVDLEDIAIESNVEEEGSVGRLHNGKHYNRCMRFHKLFYVVCMRLVWEELITWISGKNEQKSILEGLVSELELSCNVLKPWVFANMLSSVHVTKICLLFKQYKNYLCTEMGIRAKFWMNYIDLVEIMLDVIHWDCSHIMSAHF